MSRYHPLAKCEECPLYREHTYVPSYIPEKSNEIAVVGEAPGANEHRSGIPFTGESGKLLNVVLKANGIERNETLLTNACSCRPANNDTPPKEAIAACKPRLISELQENNISKTVATGNSSTESLLGKSGITRLRIGPPKKVDLGYGGVSIIPTFHPAAALRQGTFLPYIVSDFAKINGTAKVWNPPQYKVCRTVEDSIATMDAVQATNPEVLVVDIENDTFEDKDTGFEHPNRYTLLCIGFAYAKGKVVVLSEEMCTEKSVLERLGKLLRAIKIVAHNGKHDLKGLYSKVGPLKQYGDTLLASYSMSEYSGIHKPHSLGYIGIEHFGTPDWKHDLDQWQPKKYGYGAVPRDVLYKYNAFDCGIEWDVWEEYSRRLDELGLRELHDFMVRASNELVFVELGGITVDREYLPKLAEEFEDKLGILEIELNLRLKDGCSYDKSGGVNPRSPVQLKKAFKDLGASVGSTDEETCNFIIEKKGLDHPLGAFASKLLEHRGVTKDYGTYVKGIEKLIYRGRVYPNFLLHGTTSGRTSCRNPNLQNIPRKSSIRRLFKVAKETNRFINADYSQAELRILSWLSGDRYFTDIFNGEDRDIFDELSAALFPEFPKATTDKEEFKQLRARKVKPYVYGLAYGRTEYGLAPDLGITIAEARDLKEKFFTLIPRIIEWQSWVKQEVAHGNDLVSPFGRHRRFYLLTNENYDKTMREALSFLPSSTSSDVCLTALINIRRATKGYAWIRNFVHDSILLETEESNVEQIRAIMTEEMLKAGKDLVGDYVKFAVDTTVGMNWGEV